MMEDFVNGYSAEANINRDMLKAWKKPGDELTTDIPAIMGSASNGYNFTLSLEFRFHLGCGENCG